MQALLKYSVLFLAVLLLSENSNGQMHNGKFGNEWINHNQTYFKVEVTEKGFYKIDNSVLNNIAGINNVNPQDIQLFHMGQEVPVYVKTSNGNIDEVSFYADNAQASIDVNLYRNANHHFNSSYSLISDTATYFLTWNTSNVTAVQYQDLNSSFNNLPAKETYFMYESKSVNSENWNQGKFFSVSGYVLSNGVFDFGEGFGTALATSNSTSVETPYVYAAGPASTVNMTAFVQGSSYHTPQVKVGSFTETFNNYYGDSVMNIQSTLATSNIVNGTTVVEFNGLSGNTDKNAVSVVSVTYPRVFNFEGASTFKFEMPAGSRRFLEIENFDGGQAGSQNVYLYDISNKRRIAAFWDGSLVRVELPASSVDMDLVLVNETAKTAINGIVATDFLDYSLDRGDYIIISNSKLFVDSKGNNPVFDYATYRTSTGERPVIVPVNRLFDQFAYGVKGHPLAIKNFVAFITQNWQTIAPKNVFIIGKGRIYKETRAMEAADNMVPTFGFPPSDNLLLAPIGSDVPMLPVGRLSATNGDQVTDYLNKIKTIESAAVDSLNIENQTWRKQTLHLGGGANTYEHNILKNHLLNMAPVMENGLFGANVHSFFKEHNEHVSVPNSVKINDLINNGVSMITFFGHGSTKGFDFYLDAPERYKNTGKYPLVMALGCYNGTIFGEDKLISERFIFEKEAGAIGYLGFVNAVTISAASGLSTNFYNLMNNDLYGAGVGEILKRSMENFTSTPNYTYNPYYQMGAQYFVFHGDPALKLNYRTTADLHVEAASISTNPSTITADVRNFNLDVDVYNFGKYQDSTVIVKVIRKHPSGKVDTVETMMSIPRDKSTVSFMFSVNGYEDFGVNYFSVIVDANNTLTELPANAEQNNQVINFEVVIGNPIVSPTFPKEFSIVNDSALTLRAMTTNAFETNYTWEVEMDTTTEFNSSLMINNTLVAGSSMMEWTPNVTLNNGQVYYWRVRATDGNQQTGEWMTSSFLYDANTQAGGWNQSHVFQYERNDVENLLINSDQNQIFDFTPSVYEVSAKTGYIGYGVDKENLAIYQNGSKADKCRCEWENGVYVAVMDPSNLQLWTLPGHTSQYGAVNCDGGGRTASAFLFKNNSVGTQKAFESFVTDTIPTGHLVVIYTLNNGHGDRWSADFVNYLKTQGATQIDSFVNTTQERSFAMAFRKGHPNYPYFSEEVGMDKDAVVAAYTAASKAWNEGKMESALIGPAKSWEKLEWSLSHLEAGNADQASVDVYGMNSKGEKELLYSNITADSFNLSAINATSYPYLQLTLNNRDDQYNTPAQLNYWRVYGELNLDGAITIEDEIDVTYDSVANVQNVVIDLAVWNVGQSTIDSSEVEFIVLGSETATTEVNTLAPADSQNIQVHIPMLGLVGQQVIIAKLKEQSNESSLINNWGWVEVDVPSVNAETPNQDEIMTGTEEEVVSKLTNYPNPFSDETRIEFEITPITTIDNMEIFPTEVSIELYDTRGALIKKNIQDAETNNSYTWNGANAQDLDMPSGMYFCRVLPIYDNKELNAKAQQKIIKIVLTR